MKDDKLSAKEKAIDMALDRVKSRNSLQESKPKGFVLLVFAFIAVIIIAIVTFASIDSLSDNMVSFLSGIIAIGVSLVIFYYTLHNEKRKDYKLARKNALVLSEIIDSILNQISNISNGERTPVFYPQEWLEHYLHCSLYLKYDYFDIIINEINTVNRINNAIEDQNETALSKLLEQRRNNIMNSMADFDIFTTSINLNSFALEFTESKSWKEQKEYIEFDRFLIDNYTNKINELTELKLKEMNGSCDANIMGLYVMDELRKEAALKSGKYSFYASQNKVMLKSIFKVHCSLTEEDSFRLCWGILSLK